MTTQSRWVMRIREEIAASHIIVGHDGPCARLHGHNWKIDVEVASTQLNDLGMGVDFGDIKRVTREVTDPLDHRHLNDLPAFETLNPTAENVAAYVYRELKQRLNGSDFRVSGVSIWETDRCSVHYSESGD